MNNNAHFQHFQQWRQTTISLISIVLFALITVQVIYFYKLHKLKKEFKIFAGTEIVQDDTRNQELMPIIQEIDKQHLYKIFDALIEVVPPHVKLEKLEYTKETGLQLTCRAQDNASMLHFIDACSRNQILHTLKLKKSTQEDNSFMFVLN
jgi:hypothetical protein